MNPYSSNVVFGDTELSGLEYYLGQLISIGLVKLSGEELYLELEYSGPVNEFVQTEVLPNLQGPKVARNEAIARIKAFLGDGRPYLMGHAGPYDALHVYQLFVIEARPFHRVPLDFASMLFSHGIAPDQEIADYLGIDRSRFKSDHALDDARFPREVYRRATEGDL